MLANVYFFKTKFENDKPNYKNYVDNSIKYYKLSLQINPNNDFILNDLAYIYMSINQHEEAIILLNKIKDTTNVNMLFNKGQYYENKKDYNKAINFYKKVLYLEKQNTTALTKLSMIYNHVGKVDEAINVNVKFIEKNALIEEPYLNLANLYYINKDTAKAVIFAEKALKINPQNVNTLKVLYNYYFSKGNSAKANYYLKMMP